MWCRAVLHENIQIKTLKGFEILIWNPNFFLFFNCWLHIWIIVSHCCVLCSWLDCSISIRGSSLQPRTLNLLTAEPFPTIGPSINELMFTPGAAGSCQDLKVWFRGAWCCLRLRGCSAPGCLVWNSFLWNVVVLWLSGPLQEKLLQLKATVLRVNPVALNDPAAEVLQQHKDLGAEMNNEDMWASGGGCVQAGPPVFLPLQSPPG